MLLFYLFVYLFFLTVQYSYIYIYIYYIAFYKYSFIIEVITLSVTEGHSINVSESLNKSSQSVKCVSINRFVTRVFIYTLYIILLYNIAETVEIVQISTSVTKHHSWCHYM